MSAKLWAIVRREYIERVRTKGFVIGTILGPLLMAAMMIVPALAARSKGKPLRVAVLSASGELRQAVEARLACLGHREEVLLCVVDRLRDRQRHLASFSVAHADPIDLVPDHDQRGEGEVLASLHHLGHAVDVDHLLDKFAFHIKFSSHAGLLAFRVASA